MKSTARSVESASTLTTVSDSKLVRSYELWEGTQRFYLEGQVMIGRNYKNLLGTFLLINIPNFIHLIFAAQTQTVSQKGLIIRNTQSRRTPHFCF